VICPGDSAAEALLAGLLLGVAAGLLLAAALLALIDD
jgi:hypothetical protein